MEKKMKLFEQILLQEADKSRFFKPLWDEFSGDNDLVQKDGVTYTQLLNFVNKDDPLLKKQFQLRGVDWQKGSDAMKWVAICQAYIERDRKQKADETNKAAYKQKDILSMIKAEKLLVLAGENEPAYDVDFVHLSQLDNGKFTFVVPMTYEAAVFCDSAKCGGEGAKWCIGYEKTQSYWNDHTQDGQLFILAFNNESFAKGPNNREKDTLKYMITLSPDARDTEAWLQSDEPEDTIPIYKFKKFFGHDAIEMATIFANRILVEENRYSECNQDTFWDRDEEAPTYPWDDSDLVDSTLEYDDFLTGIYNIENKQPDGNGKIGSKGSWAKQLVYDKAYNEVIFDGNNKKVIPAKMQIGGNFDKGIFDIPTFCDWLKKCNVENASSFTIKNAHIEKMIHEPEASENSMDVYLENCEIDDLVYTDYSSNIEFHIDKNCHIDRLHWPCSSEHFDNRCAQHLHVDDGATIYNEEYEEEDQLNENIKHLDEKRTVQVEFMDDTEAMEFKKEMEERYGVNRASRYALPKGTGKRGIVFVESKLFNKILGETLKEGPNYGHGRNDVYHLNSDFKYKHNCRNPDTCTTGDIVVSPDGDEFMVGRKIKSKFEKTIDNGARQMVFGKEKECFETDDPTVFVETEYDTSMEREVISLRFE